MSSTTLHQLFLEAVEKHPEQVATIHDDGDVVSMVTYQQLQRNAFQICSILKRFTVDNELVGLALHPGPCLLAAILGALQRPLAFHYLDASNTPIFLESLVTRLKIRCILLHVDDLHKFEHVGHQHRFNIHRDRELEIFNMAVLCLSDLDPWVPSVPLAYSITTSGSTGQPKLVRVPHGCIVPNILDLRERFAVTQHDLVFLASPMTFDPSMVEMFLALSSGASLLLVPNIVKAVPRVLLKMLFYRHRVSILQATPTLLQRFTPEALRESLLGKDSSLRVLALGGEACPSTATLAQWRHLENPTSIYNIYGITEVSCWATIQKVSVSDLEADREVVLGEPLAGTVVEVHDEDGHRVTEGEGELFIGGDERACLLNDETTVTKATMRASGDWVKIDEDGALKYLGRHDDQVKRHGKRINLLQIEKLALECAGIIGACAVMNQQTLRLFLVSTDHQLSKTDISLKVKVTLVGKLPFDLLPDCIIVVKELPMTTHGKVDKKKLALLAVSGEEDEPLMLTNPNIVGLLERTWKCVLNIDKGSDVTSVDNFLRSGGHSLQAVQFVEEVEKVMQCPLPGLLDITLHGTFEDVSNYTRFAVDPDSKPTLKAKTLQPITENVVQDIQMQKQEFDMPPPLVSLVNKDEKDVADVRKISPPGFGIAGKKRTAKDAGLEEKLKQKHLRNERAGNEEFVYSVQRSGRKMVHVNGNSERISHGSGYDTSLTMWQNMSTSMGAAMLHQEDLSMQNERQKDIKKAGSQNSIESPTEEDIENEGKPDLFSVRRTSKALAAQPEKAKQSFLDLGAMRGTSLQKEGFSGEEGSSQMAGTTSGMREKWRFNTGKCVDASPLLALSQSGLQGAVVFIGSHSHTVSAISMETGKALWQTLLGGRVESSACLSHCGKLVVVGCYDCLVYVLAAESGLIVWRYRTEGPVKSSPVLDPFSSLVFIGSHDQHLHALDLKNEKAAWKRHLGGGSVFSSPCVDRSSQQLIAATLAGKVHALKPISGVTLWSRDLPKPVFSSPITCASGVLIGCVDGAIYCLNNQGDQVWLFQTGAPIFSSPSVASFSSTNERIVFGSHDKSVYCLTNRGELLWKFDAESEVYSSPFIVGAPSLIDKMAHYSEFDEMEGTTSRKVLSESDQEVVSEMVDVPINHQQATDVLQGSAPVIQQRAAPVIHKGAALANHQGAEPVIFQGAALVIHQGAAHDINQGAAVVIHQGAAHDINQGAAQVNHQGAAPVTHQGAAVVNQQMAAPVSKIRDMLMSQQSGALIGQQMVAIPNAGPDIHKKQKGAAQVQSLESYESSDFFQAATVTTSSQLTSPHPQPQGSKVMDRHSPALGQLSGTGSSPSDSSSTSYTQNKVLVIACSTNGKIVLLDLKEGALLASHQLPGEVFSSPIEEGNHIVVGCRDDFIYCLDIL